MLVVNKYMSIVTNLKAIDEQFLITIQFSLTFELDVRNAVIMRDVCYFYFMHSWRFIDYFTHVDKHVNRNHNI